VRRLKNAYRASRIINHEIGFNLMKQASLQNNWNLDLREIASIWTNGCIIRSVLMNEISVILGKHESILNSPDVVSMMKEVQHDFAYIVSQGLQSYIAMPVLSSALNYYLGFITAESSANLIQAQRDYFGAHTYRRNDRAAGKYFHTDWKPI
jgi:6-phosphogluconate dehydrogenase